jgi:hypothetical protein
MNPVAWFVFVAAPLLVCAICCVWEFARAFGDRDVESS